MVQPKPAFPVLNPASPLSVSLLAAHPLVDGIGTTIGDISGNAYDGAAVGGFTWFNDPELGVVAELDGTTGFINLGAAINPIMDVQTGATVAFWLKLRNATPASTAKSGLITLQDFAGASSATHYPDTDGSGDFGTFREISRFSQVNLGATDRATWHHLAITSLSGGTYRVYIGGVEVANTSAEFGIHATITATIGKSTDSGGDYFLDGWIGDFRLWSRELAAPEILTMFNDPWALYDSAVVLTAQTFVLRAIADMTPEAGSAAKSVVAQVDMRSEPATAVTSTTAQIDLNAFAANAAEFLGVQVDVVPTAQTSFPAIVDGIDPERKPDTPTKFASPLDTSMVVAIPFSEGAGVTAADFAGSAGGPHNAALVGAATWSSGGFRANDYTTALGLDPNASYAEITRHLEHEPATSITVAAWVVPTSTQTSRAIVAKLGTAGFSFYLGTETDQWRFQVQDNIDGVATVDSGIFTPGELYHVVGTYDGTFVKIYVNGVEANSIGNSGTIVYDIGKNVRIGQGEGGSSFIGTIDSVRIWGNRVLDADEVFALYKNPYGIYCSYAIARSVVTLADMRIEPTSAIKALVAQVDFREAPASAATAVVAQVDFNPFAADAATFLGMQVDVKTPAANASGLSILSIDPNSGTISGGTPITLKGLRFQNITDVQFGGVSLTSIVNPNQATITGVTGAHVSGSVGVTVFSSTKGNITLDDGYTYLPFFGPGSDLLLKGVQIDPSLVRTEYFTGETAPLAANTALSFVLADYPIDVSAAELYVRRVGEKGGTLQRQGAIYQYDVDLLNRQIIWRSTATYALIPTDEIIIRYLAQGTV